MAKLYFHYATMNAGKTTMLLQASYNYRERGMTTMLFVAGHYRKGDTGLISSRGDPTCTTNDSRPSTACARSPR